LTFWPSIASPLTISASTFSGTSWKVFPALPEIFLPSSGSTPRPSSVYPLEHPLTEIRRLLNVRYRPGRVAEELGCEVRPLYRSTIPAGCPCERDERGNLWIVGDRFRDWMRSVQREAVSQNLMHADLTITNGVYGVLAGCAVQQAIASLGRAETANGRRKG
jgi:hypothetical protein